jgi:hypothetical protein
MFFVNCREGIMRRYAVVLMLLLALTMIGALCSNSKDSGGGSGGEVNPPPGTCDSNTAPVLTAIGFLVGDAATEGDASAAMNDTIRLVAAFDDGQCNLGGGTLLVTVDGADTPDSVTVSGQIACPQDSLQESPISYAVMPASVGEMTFEVSLKDLCGEQSNSLSAILTVTETTADDTADDTSADDASDDTAGDDDTAAGTARLEGAVSYGGDKTATIVNILFYTHWLPTELPVASVPLTVPETGFPFDYDEELTDIAQGNYYLAAYFDAVEGDGWYNPTVDPTSSPWYTVAIADGQTTHYDITLVDPSR